MASLFLPSPSVAVLYERTIIVIADDPDRPTAP